MNIKYLILLIIAVLPANTLTMTTLTSMMKTRHCHTLATHKQLSRPLLRSLSASKKLEMSDIVNIYPVSYLLDLSPENIIRTAEDSVGIKPVLLKNQYPYKYNAGGVIYAIDSELEAGKWHEHICSEVGLDKLWKNDMTKEARDRLAMSKSKSRLLLQMELYGSNVGKQVVDKTSKK